MSRAVLCIWKGEKMWRNERKGQYLSNVQVQFSGCSSHRNSRRARANTQTHTHKSISTVHLHKANENGAFFQRERKLFERCPPFPPFLLKSTLRWQSCKWLLVKGSFWKLLLLLKSSFFFFQKHYFADLSSSFYFLFPTLSATLVICK